MSMPGMCDSCGGLLGIECFNTGECAAITASIAAHAQEQPSRLDGRLEPEAKHGCVSVAEAAALSIAISLKRIADTIDGTAAGLCVTETMLGGRRGQ